MSIHKGKRLQVSDLLDDNTISISKCFGTRESAKEEATRLRRYGFDAKLSGKTVRFEIMEASSALVACFSDWTVDKELTVSTFM